MKGKKILKVKVKSLVKEHVELVKALKSKNPKLLKKEAKEQGKELKQYKRLK